MKKLLYLLTAFFFITCEDVIDVDLPDTEPRLVVDALMRVDPTSNLTEVRVKTTISSGFFDEIQPNTQDISMNLLNATQALEPIPFVPDPEDPGTFVPEGPDGTAVGGGFIPSSFFANADDEFILSFVYNDEVYIAVTKPVFTNPIESIEQGTDTLFEGDETEIIINFTDPEDQENYYLFDFDFNEFLTTEDTFYNGEQFEFSYFYEDELEVGQELEISIMGVDRQFYNYLNQILSLSEDQGPFQTPVSTARGNILNADGIDNEEVFNNVGREDNFVLGYFAIVQEYKATFTIEDLN